MGRASAYFTSDRKKLFFRQSPIPRCSAGDPEAIFVVVHELAHLVLHKGNGPSLPRMVDGNVKSRGLAEQMGAEHRANRFARTFLMQNDEIEQYPDHNNLAEECNVPPKQTAQRLKDFQATKSYIAYLPDLAETAWEAARTSIDPVRDPIRFRLSRGGLLVERGGFNKPDHKFGWFEEYGSVVSYQEDRHR